MSHIPVRGRSLLRRLTVTAFLAAGLAVVGVQAAAPSYAAPVSFTNGTTIQQTAADQGPAGPYPATVPVGGLTGTVTSVQLHLEDFSHTFGRDNDMLLVAPGGGSLVVYSDTGGSTTFTNVDLDLVDGSPAINAVTTLVSGTYAPTNSAQGSVADAWPAPAPVPSAATTFAGAFAGSNPNGAWQLYIVDDLSGDIGSIGGWNLTVTTTGSPATPFTSTARIDIPRIQMSPYPSPITVTGVPASTPVANVAVRLDNLNHPRPQDLDLMLVSPSGDNLVLLSDADGTTAVSGVSPTFTDGPAALGAGTYDTATYGVSAYDPGDTFPTPAPTPSADTSFGDAFGGTVANGTWLLYVVDDDQLAAAGNIGGWTLTVTPAETQTITFTSTPPTPARVGDVYVPTATGGGSGNPVTFSVAPGTTNDSCRVDQAGTSVVFRESGTCVIAADQAGNQDYLPAPRVTQTVQVVSDIAVATLAISPLDASTTAGVGVTYTVVGLDDNGIVIPGQTSTVTYTPTGGGDSVVCPAATCTPTEAGSYTVTASAPGSAGPITTSTTLTVTADDAAALTITPEDETTAAGVAVPYTVTATDPFGNDLGEVTAITTVVATPIGPGAPVGCPAGVCTLTVAGVYSVSADQTGPGAPTGDSTTLTVVPGPAGTIEVTPLDVTMTAGDAQQYVVTAYDEFGNALPDVTGDTDVTASGPEAIDCPNARCAPTAAGVYDVLASYGALTDTTSLTVEAGDLTAITVTPEIATTRAGVPVTYTATGVDAFGNDLGDVTADTTFTYEPIDGSTTATGCDDNVCTVEVAGTYEVVGTIGTVSDTASLTVTVSTAVLEIEPVGDVTYGDDVPLATVSGADGVPTGVVQFTVDGVAVGAPAPVGPGGEVVGPVLTDPDAGLHEVQAVFSSGTAGYGLASHELAFVVAQAETSVDLDVTAGSLTATVTSPNGLTPDGDVVFAIDGDEVGTVALVDGVAVFSGDTTGKPDSVVTATYTGAKNYLPSAGSNARLDPTVTATLDRAPVDGWFNAPVTVTFACTPGSAPVTCPAPVVIDAEGAAQTVTRTVVAADGGIAMVTSEPVSIDLTDPTAVVRRVVDGRFYNGIAPDPVCGSADALSGVASCELTTTGTSPGRLVTTVTVTDVAGNTATAVASYKVRATWVNATKVGKAWEIEKGKRRTFHVVGGPRPVFVNPMTGERVRGVYARQYDDKSHWVARLLMPRSATTGRTYAVKVLQRSRSQNILVRAVS